MPLIDSITIKLSCQQYESTSYELGEEKSVIRLESMGKGSDAFCPYCGSSHCHIQGRQETRLKDMPVWPGIRQEAEEIRSKIVAICPWIPIFQHYFSKMPEIFALSEI